ncbi:hypothetical protein BGW36DRAFT_300332 [Talaromyces proteolyticus]|uniref:FAD-binding domain-containing protein n=1 Tax=Talaromyces proteolyticus TaxID=1131652 RepID=A0AAD4KJN4_9EURO|nr:uncharacterized protein BGW36DRAFT_300332 [Talaromyces proteolyticus]KAH8693841.1 hypothetical protein BGW36DRAFT_300332 [Talaromyces proteolyticus]
MVPVVQSKNDSRPLRIAIVGGGLAGAAAAGVLSRLPNVKVRAYERAPAIREAGAQIAVMVTALKVLRRMLSPAAWDYLQSMLYRGEGADGIHHRHWRTGEILSTATSPDTARHMQEGRVSRVSLHRTLMMDVPDGVFEYGREVVKVETSYRQKEVTLHLKNGDTKTADLLVVADGLYSKIRSQYLPETDITYKGLVAYRINFPASKLAHIGDLPNDSSSFRKGSNVVILSHLEPGTYSFAAFLQEPEEFAKSLRWEHALGQPGIDRIKSKLVGWHPLIGKILDALPGIDAYPLQGTKWMEHLIRDDTVAFVGDAAHPTAGGWGTGSAFAFADVWTLYRSLHRTYRTRPKPMDADKVPYNIPYALHLFNETRRHFLQRVERQFDYDKIDTKYVSEALGDEEEFVYRYRERYTSTSWILEHDPDARWQEVEAEERHQHVQQEKRLSRL